jgi:hypothetical protein
MPKIVQCATHATVGGGVPIPVALPKPITPGNYIMVFLEDGQPFNDLPKDASWPPATSFAGLPLIFNPNTENNQFTTVSFVPVYGGKVETTTLPDLPAEPWSGPNPNNGGTIFTILEISGAGAVSFGGVLWTQNEECTVSSVETAMPKAGDLGLLLAGWSNGYGATLVEADIAPADWTILVNGAQAGVPWWLLASSTLPAGKTKTTITTTAATPMSSYNGVSPDSIFAIIA